MEDAKQISLFCRVNMNAYQDLPIRSSERGLLIYLVKTNNEEYQKAMVTSLIKEDYIYKQVSKKISDKCKKTR